MSEEITRAGMIPQRVEREAQRTQASRDELVERFGRAVRSDGTVEPLEGLHLSLRLNLDPVIVGSVLVEAGHLSPQKRIDVRAIDVSALDSGLLDAVARLVRLVDAPAEAPFLASPIRREGVIL
jgi:hypothetical protein